MKKNLFCAVVAVVSVFAFSGSALAHHGDANRYNDEMFTITGTLVQLQMVNPHALIVFDVTEDGKTTRWTAEMGGPQQLMRQFGWTTSTVKVGDKVTVTGRKVKSGAPYMNLTERANLVLTDSKKEIFRTANFGQPATPAPAN